MKRSHIDETGTIVDKNVRLAMEYFAERTAHDLNNMITPLLAYPDMLVRMLPDESCVNVVKALQESAERAHHFTKRLSALAGGDTTEAKEFDIAKVTSEALGVVREQVGTTSGITIEGNLEENCLFHMQEAVFLHALEALLDNAIGAVSRTESGGNVAVTLKKVRIPNSTSGLHSEIIPGGGYYRLSVQDTGQGMTKADMSYAIEPFVKGEHKGPGCGGGLGLSIAYCALRRNGAYLQIESSPEQGTTASMYFPVKGEEGLTADPETTTKESGGMAAALAGGSNKAKQTATSEQVASETSPAKDGKVQRVLVVDDEAPIVDLFKMILENFLSDVSVDVAANGQEALDLFKAKNHPVLVMDLHMPVMDGQSAFFALQRYCEEAQAQMPSVVFCTGYAPQAPLLEAVEADPRHAMLNKPVQSEILVNMVRDRLPSEP